jgi:hypothetical protein
LIWPPRSARKFPTPVQEARQGAAPLGGELRNLHKAVMEVTAAKRISVSFLRDWLF